MINPLDYEARQPKKKFHSIFLQYATLVVFLVCLGLLVVVSAVLLHIIRRQHLKMAATEQR